MTHKARACPIRSSSSPHTCTSLVNFQHANSDIYRKCNSKKNSSTREDKAGSLRSDRAIGISTSGLSMSSLNATKSSGRAMDLISRIGELCADSFEEIGLL